MWIGHRQIQLMLNRNNHDWVQLHWKLHTRLYISEIVPTYKELSIAANQCDPIGQHFATLAKVRSLGTYLVFGKILNLPWQFYLGQMFNFVNGQI